MKLLKTLELDIKEIELDEQGIRGIFDTYDIIWGGQFNDVVIGWKSDNIGIINQVIGSCESLSEFINEDVQRIIINNPIW